MLHLFLLALCRPLSCLVADDFLASYGEPLEQTLNLDTWESGPDLASIFDRLDQEVRQALTQEDEMRRHLRRTRLSPDCCQAKRRPEGLGSFKRRSRTSRLHSKTSCLTGR